MDSDSSDLFGSSDSDRVLPQVNSDDDVDQGVVDQVPDSALFPDSEEEEEEGGERRGWGRGNGLATSQMSSPVQFSMGISPPSSPITLPSSLAHRLSQHQTQNTDESEHEMRRGLGGRGRGRGRGAMQSRGEPPHSSHHSSPPPAHPSIPPTSTAYATMISESEQNVIWGTTINVNETSDAFRSFLTNFREPTSPSISISTSLPSPSPPLYMNLFSRLATIEATDFNLDCAHLNLFDSKLYEQLILYPQVSFVSVGSVIVLEESVLEESVCWKKV
jgi:hypothetical protein